MAIVINTGSGQPPYVQLAQPPALNPQAITPADDFDAWKQKIILMTSSAAGYEAGNKLYDIYHAVNTVPLNQPHIDQLVKELKDNQPTAVFHKMFDWGLLKNGRDPANEATVINFIKQKYNLTDDQARAYSNGVSNGISITGLKFLPSGEIDHANSLEQFQAQITPQEITALNLPWVGTPTDQQKLDAFTSKFALDENNEYHVEYARIVLPQLKQTIPHAEDMANVLQKSGDWAKKIGRFEIKEYGYAFEFRSDTQNPTNVTSKLTVSRNQFQASNGEDCVLDALLLNTQLAMHKAQVSGSNEWQHGVSINAANDELIKSAAVFRQAGVLLDADTKKRVQDLFDLDPNNRIKFNNIAVAAATRWQNPNITIQTVAQLIL